MSSSRSWASSCSTCCWSRCGSPEGREEESLHAERERLAYLGGGPLAAIVLGVLLVPLRGLTPAANVAYAFVTLTIVVGEFGGRAAAVLTALASPLSLDLFLTEPYLRLSIRDGHDLIAFLGLAACGLLAAAFASAHGRRARSLARRQLELLRSAVAALLADAER